MNTGDETKVDGRSLRYQHRRPELLAAATDYVLDNGISDLSLRAAASGLGVTHATLLRHFGTKEELITAVISAIRDGLQSTMRNRVGDLTEAQTVDALHALWRELCRPAQRRQFLVLFEIVTIQAREPDRFTDLTKLLVTDFTQPVETNLRNHGRSRAEARDIATGFLAVLRGLQLDLAVSGDRARVNAAMDRYINLTVGNPPNQPRRQNQQPRTHP